jgi:hypothetical protein
VIRIGPTRKQLACADRADEGNIAQRDRSIETLAAEPFLHRFELKTPRLSLGDVTAGRMNMSFVAGIAGHWARVRPARGCVTRVPLVIQVNGLGDNLAQHGPSAPLRE